MKNIQIELKNKRTIYVIGLINQFRESTEVQNIYNCYEYVRLVHEFNGLSNFRESLNEEERTLLSQNLNVWFMCFESLSTFNVFIENQGVIL